ncbi:hypothetical protein HII31_11406 [Pseudocercospora fuligena]|uniref:Uncharacterized protein n=1 Tax=Pseudocercospora fuligena TaxID=685502 RepID=A0A8H6VCL3_9PEZI|nr:hypothetical protein HII31_11406 [Pseudocercospora fuligena]
MGTAYLNTTSPTTVEDVGGLEGQGHPPERGDWDDLFRDAAQRKLHNMAPEEVLGGLPSAEDNFMRSEVESGV